MCFRFFFLAPFFLWQEAQNKIRKFDHEKDKNIDLEIKFLTGFGDISTNGKGEVQ